MTDTLRSLVSDLRYDLHHSYPNRAPYDIPSTVIDRLDSILAAQPAHSNGPGEFACPGHPISATPSYPTTPGRCWICGGATEPEPGAVLEGGPHRTAFDVGRNIVNQLADLWQVPVDVRQATNDDCWEFAERLISEYVTEVCSTRQPSGAAVEAGAKAAWHLDDKASMREVSRAVLEAAYRVDAPRPMLDRQAMVWAMCRADRKEPEGKSADWLQLAEETFGRYVDAVMGLVRPLPTEEQLDEWLTEHEEVWRFHEGAERRTRGCGCGWEPDSWDSDDQFYEYYREHRNGAVLALLNGAGA